MQCSQKYTLKIFQQRIDKKERDKAVPKYGITEFSKPSFKKQKTVSTEPACLAFFQLPY